MLYGHSGLDLSPTALVLSPVQPLFQVFPTTENTKSSLPDARAAHLAAISSTGKCCGLCLHNVSRI